MEAVFDVQKKIIEAEARHPRLPVLPSGDVVKIIATLEGTKVKSFNNLDLTILTHSPWKFSIIFIIIILLCVVTGWCLYKRWIGCPLMKRRPILKTQIINMERSNKEKEIDLYEYYHEQLRRKKQLESVNIEC